MVEIHKCKDCGFETDEIGFSQHLCPWMAQPNKGESYQEYSNRQKELMIAWKSNNKDSKLRKDKKL